MIILKKIVKVIKIKLSNCKNIKKYTSFYYKAENNICNRVSKNFKMTILATSMLLQEALYQNMRAKYADIFSIIELK